MVSVSCSRSLPPWHRTLQELIAVDGEDEECWVPGLSNKV